MTRVEWARIAEEDRRLLVVIANAMDEVKRRSGERVVCRLGCTECCRGPFEITALDALRLRAGLRALESTDAARAERVKARAGESVAATAEEEDRMCPALDPETGGCNLYAARPVTCRTFGPATRTVEGGVAACELCYAGEEDDAVAACAVEVDGEGLEAALLEELEGLGSGGATTVGEALRQAP